MSKYNSESQIKEIQQRIANMVSYILFCYEKGYITERTKKEMLKILDPNKGGE